MHWQCANVNSSPKVRGGRVRQGGDTQSRDRITAGRDRYDRLRVSFPSVLAHGFIKGYSSFVGLWFISTFPDGALTHGA